MRDEIFLYDASQLRDILPGSCHVLYESRSTLIISLSKYFPNDQFFDLLLDLQLARRHRQRALSIITTDLPLLQLDHQPLAFLFQLLRPTLPTKRLLIIVRLL